MTASRLTQRELFEATLELAPPERAAYLDAHCANPAQRASIERMLSADADDNGRPLDDPVDRLLDRVGEVVDEAWPAADMQVGPFQVLEKLGEGGSSVVYRAAREQDGVTQLVALKLLRRGLYSADEQRRFRDERRALAHLRHPGIAQLIEGGVTPNGVAYIALELIEGLPITEHARSHGLDLQQRLALFVQVCRAVEAAHRALIVHRDLKPSNVLVTDTGAVKLLDFGIAKLLEIDSDDTTRTEHRAMTPAYAAPEQFSGEQITTATDVYGLGVLLAELLTGQRREHGDTRTPSSQVGADTEPGVLPAPAAKTRRQLRGDLDNIVLQATADEPTLRYASAGALADDIERHLADQPVIAHPPSRLYRARKFVARHRGGVATTFALLLAVFAALGLALWQATVARQQTRIAVAQAQRATAVRDFLVDIFDAQIPSGPRNEMPDTAELLQRGAQRARTELTSTPALQSDLLIALGNVYDHLARPDQGEPLLDAAIAAARRVVPLESALLGEALSERGELDLSRDRYAPALDYFEQAIALQRRADPQGLPLALTLHRRALAHSKNGQYPAAISDYEAALAIRRQQLADDDPEILNDYDAIGAAYDREGQTERATDYLRRAVEGARAKFGPAHVKTAHFLKNYSANQGFLGHYAKSAALTEEAVHSESLLYPPDSPDLANGLNNLGFINIVLGRLLTARQTLEKADALLTNAGQDSSMGRTFVLDNLARVDEALGDDAQALQRIRSAERISLELVGAQHARSLHLALHRARLEFLADPAHATALATLAQRIVADPDALAQFRERGEIEASYSLGLALEALGKKAEAGAALQRAVALFKPEHVDPILLPVVSALATWDVDNAHRDDAQSLLRRYIDIAVREVSATHFGIGELQLQLAELLADQNPSEARQRAVAAGNAFAELPATHPWRQRLAALDTRLSTQRAYRHP